MRITLASEEPFAFAGLWETWRNPNGEPVGSCTIITTQANELVALIHDHMPHPVERAGGALAGQRVAGYRRPCQPARSLSPDAMDTIEDSALVNSAFNDGPELLAPAQRPRFI